MKRGVAIALMVLGIAALAGFAIHRWRAHQEPERGPTVRVERGELVETASASGKIEPHVQVEVKSRGSGEVIEVLVKEGQAVKAGDLLVQLDPADAERAVKDAKTAQRRIQAQLGEARASLSVAQLELANADTNRQVSARGADLGLVSSETARTAGHSHSIAGANVKLRQAQLGAMYTQVETAQLAVEDAERRLLETKIHAPIDGTVLSVAVEKGSIVSSALTNVGGGTALLTLADLSDLRVIGDIDEAQIGRVAPGQPVLIRVDAYPDRTFQGKVERVSPLGVAETNGVVTFDVEIVVTDKDRDKLRSGMSADLEIVTQRHQDVLLLPLMAIQSVGAARFVRLAGGERQAIETGATDGTHIVVLSGLEEGDEVLISPAGGAGPARAPRPSGPLPMGRRGMR